MPPPAKGQADLSLSLGVSPFLAYCFSMITAHYFWIPTFKKGFYSYLDKLVYLCTVLLYQDNQCKLPLEILICSFLNISSLPYPLNRHNHVQ